MSILTIDAHCIDKEFEQKIEAVYGVSIVSMEGAPWSVVFEGPASGLKAMVVAEWGESTYSDSDIEAKCMKNQTLLVGGAVRDHLLGIQSKDRDYVVVGSSPEEMIANGFMQVGASFPVFLHPVTGDEYALARTERKTGVGYHGFSTTYDSSVTLEDDLARRDLTINSMAMTDNLQIIDPFNGIKDLENGVLRHTSEAFADDPLRVLRLARFAARYHFSVADETMELSRKLVDSGELDALPRERIWTELYKGFTEKAPSRMLKVLQDAHAMKVTPLVEYFGTDFDVDDARNHMGAASMVKTNVNRVDANAVFAMPMLFAATPPMKVPNHVRDAAKLEKLLTAVLSDMTSDSVHKFFNTSRFVTDFNTETMQLAIFVSKVKAVVRKDVSWQKNLSRLTAASAAIKKLDMAAVVAAGDMKTVKVRVDAAKFAVVKRRFK